MKHLISILVLVVLVASLGTAGEWRPLKKPALRADGDVSVVRSHRAIPAGQVVSNAAAALTWASVDSSNNEFGQANSLTNVLAYDPTSGTLALIHRAMTTGNGGYGAGSGQLWYNLSTNGGTSWTRVSELNAGVAGLNSRYPSNSISNNGAGATYVYSAPELTGGAFGAIRFGSDQPAGTGAPFSFEQEPPPTLSSQTTIWTGTGSDYVFWAAAASAPVVGTVLFRTGDFYGTVNQGIPSGWEDSTFQATKKGASTTYSWLDGASHGGVEYFGMLAVFAGDTLAVPDTNFQYDYNVGYAKSTDNGATWSNWVRPQAGPSKSWKGLPGFGPSYFISAGNTGTYANAHMVVDANGRVHAFTVVVDTATSVHSIVEIYETGSGWAANKIKTGTNNRTVQDFAGLDQDSWDLRTAISPDGTVIAAFWLDAATSATTDTIPDIWFASRSITGGWSTPANITTSPNVAELVMHVAPKLKANGSDSYTAYLTREYTLPSFAADPLVWFPPTSSVPVEITATSYTFTQLPTGVSEKPGIAVNYALQQNYPNPFNPATKINYAISSSSVVKLVVYNVLGQEVATLVNEFQTAGTHTVEFKAGNLASGVYFYSLKAGNFTDVKKMVLMK